nr:hypothetical protein [Candidatus Cloacimonadota bacterium]
MIASTTPTLEGFKIVKYYDIVTGEAIMGANIVRDLVASITDVIGGRSKAYESKLQEGRKDAIHEMEMQAMKLGANAVVGVDIDYEVVGQSMLMVAASGTAVSVEPIS